jgi:hypothetical protein
MEHELLYADGMRQNLNTESGFGRSLHKVTEHLGVLFSIKVRSKGDFEYVVWGASTRPTPS